MPRHAMCRAKGAVSELGLRPRRHTRVRRRAGECATTDIPGTQALVRTLVVRFAFIAKSFTKETRQADIATLHGASSLPSKVPAHSASRAACASFRRGCQKARHATEGVRLPKVHPLTSRGAAECNITHAGQGVRSSLTLAFVPAAEADAGNRFGSSMNRVLLENVTDVKHGEIDDETIF